MKKNVPIRKVVNTSLAFLISVSHTTPAMEANDVQGGSRELRGHEYYDQKLKNSKNQPSGFMLRSIRH